ncbi:MAG: iron-sulfur cluster assembly accessory protein [Gammaproteobacteria bacterium]|nr:iron-sulfur cluster assembly accessory protein [Gammaproteobacteria bacterium]
MITLTPAAIAQVHTAAKAHDVTEPVLRLAARMNPDGSMHYGMGFDSVKDDDLNFTFDNVTVVFSGEYGPLLKGATIDYVEMEPGQFHFIFLNPNDSNCTPPGGGDSGGGGCGGCGGGGCS